MNSKAELLQRPFAPDQISRRPGRDGDDVIYVESYLIIQRLNLAFDGEWSFTIDSHQILEDEVIVLGRLSAGNVVKMAFGAAQITRARNSGKPVSIGADLKAAATKAVTKAAQLLGVGLDLHASVSGQAGEANASAAPPPKRTATATRDNRTLSEAQLRAIRAITKRLGWSEDRLARVALDVAGQRDVEQLDKGGASALIERLQAEATPAGASR